MLIIGVDYHPSFQQIAFLNRETGGVGLSQPPRPLSGRVLPAFRAIMTECPKSRWEFCCVCVSKDRIHPMLLILSPLG
jgi:hypothetical protein